MLQVLTGFFSALCDFFVILTSIVFLHCFYDFGIQLNKKKILAFIPVAFCEFVSFSFLGISAISVPLTVLLLVLYTVIAVHDYKGKKFHAAWRIIGCTMLLLVFIQSSASLLDTCMFSERYIIPADPAAMEAWLADTGTPEEIIASATSLEGLLVTLIVACCFLIPAFFLLYKQYRKGVSVRCGKREIIWMLLVMLLPFIAHEAIISSQFLPKAPFWTIAIYALLFAFLFPVAIFSGRLNGYYRNRSSMQEQHMQAELDHFQQYRLTQEENSRFHHDIRNNLLCLNNMMEDGRTEDAAQYLKDLVKAVDRPTKQYITGDPLLDGIVAVKAQVMAQEGIEFQLEGVLAGGLPWKPMDICNVFANALDNAIEACQRTKIENPKISMDIRSTPNYWFITIENPVEKKVDTSKLFQKNSGYTSKQSGSIHGIGTYNMRHTLEAYGAMLKADCTDERFTLEIMVDKGSPE